MKATLAFLLAASLLWATGSGAADPTARCGAAKMKAAAAKTSAKLKCHARAAAHAAPVDPACLNKAEQKFSGAWAQLVAKGGCVNPTNESTVEDRVDACVASILSVTQPTCGDIGGACGGECPLSENCFALRRCDGSLELCRCHSSTSTCPPTSTTSTTLP